MLGSLHFSPVTFDLWPLSSLYLLGRRSSVLYLIPNKKLWIKKTSLKTQKQKPPNINIYIYIIDLISWPECQYQYPLEISDWDLRSYQLWEMCCHRRFHLWYHQSITYTVIIATTSRFVFRNTWKLVPCINHIRLLMQSNSLCETQSGILYYN